MTSKDKEAPLNQSFVDNRDWNFMACNEKIDLFKDDLDCTSATDFFSRTNGLGSPDFYAEKRLKELETKENAVRIRHAPRRVSQSQKTDVEEVAKPKSVDPEVKRRQSEELRRRFSASTNLGRIAVPEREDVAKAKRSASLTRSNPVKPLPIKTFKTAEKRVVTPKPISIPKPATPSRAVVVASSKPITRSKSAKAEKAVTTPKPVIISTPKIVPKPRVISTPKAIAKPRVISEPKIASQSVVKPVKIVTKSQADAMFPKKAVVLPDQPERIEDDKGPMTRSKVATRQRMSYMMPTESSRRRSVLYATQK